MQCSFPHLPLLSYPSLLLSHPPFLLFRYLALSSLVLPFLFIPQVLAPPLNPAKGPLEHCKLPQWVRAEPGRQTGFGAF